MIYDRLDESSLNITASYAGINQPVPTFSELMQSAENAFYATDSVFSRRYELEAIWGPIVDQINEVMGPRYQDNFYRHMIGTDYEGGSSDASFETAFPNPTESWGWSFMGIGGNGNYSNVAQSIIDQVTEYEQNNPGSFAPEFIESLNLEALDQRAIQSAQATQREFEEMFGRASGLSAGVASLTGQLVGGVYEATQDPVQVFGMALGGTGNLLRFVATELAVNAGIEITRQPAVADWYDRLGIEYTASDFFQNITTSAVAGAGIATAFRGIGVGVGRLIEGQRAPEQRNPVDNLSVDQVREMVDALQSAGAQHTPDSRAALNIAEAMIDDIDSNPGLDPSAHINRLEVATQALNAGRAPDELPIDGPDVLDPALLQRIIDQDRENLGGVLFSFDPREINVDARTFQFKAGGDEFGVTNRLLYNTVWDPNLAGVVTVYEYADGRLFIADGHQRVGLARRIMSQDPTQQIQLYGYRLREVDGVTPEQAMVQAAMTNIAQGTGSVIDAAKIARMDVDRFQGMIGRTLSPTSALVRDAQGLMRLNDDAFGAIVNEIIEANYGAIVGRILADKPELQMSAIRVLNESNPANLTQAESIVRQVRESDFNIETQENLFGEEIVIDSLFGDRARIMDKAIKQLRTDRSAFASLTRNAETIESAGNALDRVGNKTREQIDAQAIALIQTIANRKGSLSDALTDAARLAKSTGRDAPSVRQFVESVRRAIADGDFEGVDGGEVRVASYDTPPRNRDEIAQEPNLKGFDEPEGTGQAAEQQLDDLTLDMFGAAPEAAAPAPAVRTPKEIEADLKARQPVETVDDIYTLAPEAQNYIADIGRRIQDELGIEFKDPGLKDIDDAKSKMIRKSYASANQMTDISRAGFIVNKASDADEIAARFGRDAEILDEGWNVTPDGYFDRKILVRTPNGIVAEIQIWSPELLKAKTEIGHKLYAQMRKSNDPQVREDLARQQRELYAEALNREDQSFRALLGIEKAPKTPSNADLNAASSAITRPDSQTSAASTGVQGAPGARIATASLGEMEMAGRPSQSTNIIDGTPSRRDISTDIGTPQADMLSDVDLDMEIPNALLVDPETGETSMTLRSVRDMLDEEDRFINRLGVCGL